MLAAFPAAALAQVTSNSGGATRTDASGTSRTYDNGQELPWGLLGLLGLGGLLGLRRRRGALGVKPLPEDFDPQNYLRLNPDVAQAGFDPREHYVRHGCHEGRRYRR